MNEIVNNFLLAGDKFMSSKHLRQPEFTCSACGPFSKNKERIHKLRETGDLQYIYQKELDKTFFQLDMAYGDFKDVTRRTASDKILRDKAFNIAKSLEYDGYQGGLTSMLYNFFDKKTDGGAVKNEYMSNKEFAEELPKLINRILKKRKVYPAFIGNMWSADPVDMQI